MSVVQDLYHSDSLFARMYRDNEHAWLQTNRPAKSAESPGNVGLSGDLL